MELRWGHGLSVKWSMLGDVAERRLSKFQRRFLRVPRRGTALGMLAGGVAARGRTMDRIGSNTMTRRVVPNVGRSPLGWLSLTMFSALLSALAPQAFAEGDDGARVPRVYDISDLVEQSNGMGGTLGTASEESGGALGPAGYLGGSKEGSGEVGAGFLKEISGTEGLPGEGGADFSYAEVIATTLRNLLGVAESAGDAVTVAENRFLICIVDDARHRKVARFLERLREERLTLIQISTVMVHASPAATLPDGFGDSPYLLGDDLNGKERLLALLGTIDGVDLVDVPDLTVFPLQRANVSMIRQVSYIAGYDTHTGVLPKKEDVVVPDIQIVSDGLLVNCQAVLVEDDAISLDLKLILNELIEPVETKETPRGPIALPVLNVRRFNTSLVIPAGGAAVLPTANKADGESFVVIFIGKLVPVTERDG